MLSHAIMMEKPASSIAPVNPPRAFTFPVPKLNLGFAAFFRA